MKKQNKSKLILQPKIIVGVLLTIFIGVSLFLRIALPYDNVFVGDWIKFTCNDAYYHMRLVDNLVHNFPKLTFFDPYFIYSSGIIVNGTHFFDWLLSSIIWLISLGNPTQYTIDVVGVYFPVVLAALVVIPVYFIGGALFNKWVGVISASLIAILPGEFMGRSILGATDHHIAEVLFSTTVIMFLILAVKRTGTKSIVYSILSGIFLGIYLLTWAGGLLFVLIVSLYLIVQIVINHLQCKSSVHLSVIGFITFLTGFAINLTIALPKDIQLAMIFILLAPVVLSSLSWLMLKTELKTGYYPLLLAGIGVISLGILYLIVPSVLSSMLSNFNAFIGVGATTITTMELQPLLYPQGTFSTAVAWSNFTIGLYLVPVAFIALVQMSTKRRFQEQCWLLLLIWTLVIIVLTLMQRRYAYYLAVNVALLTGYLSYQVIKFANSEQKAKKAKRKKNYAGVVLVATVVLSIVLLPNVIQAKTMASQTVFAPSNEWQESLLWIKENSPEPFHGADIYYDYQGQDNFGKYTKPDYSITAWWDYGYWITRIAHRVPSANPSQDPEPIKKVANLFLAQNEDYAKGIIEELGTKYIVLDYLTSSNKFYALAIWAGKAEEEFSEVYYVAYEGQLKPIRIFYVEYYQSMVVRLYNFDGKAVIRVRPTVITYVDKVDSEGEHYKLITYGEEFDSYKVALDFVNRNATPNIRIISTNPFISSVPLEALPDYRLVHNSGENIMSGVKVFEYTR